MGECSGSPGLSQLPQGGIEPGESAKDAFFREVAEELGNGNCEILRAAGRQTKYLTFFLKKRVVLKSLFRGHSLSTSIGVEITCQKYCRLTF